MGKMLLICEHGQLMNERIIKWQVLGELEMYCFPKTTQRLSGIKMLWVSENFMGFSETNDFFLFLSSPATRGEFSLFCT